MRDRAKNRRPVISKYKEHLNPSPILCSQKTGGSLSRETEGRKALGSGNPDTEGVCEALYRKQRGPIIQSANTEYPFCAQALF